MGQTSDCGDKNIARVGSTLQVVVAFVHVLYVVDILPIGGV